MTSFITPTQTFDIRPAPQYVSKQLTQYEIDTLSTEQRRLKYFSDKTNDENNEKTQKETFINLSIVEIFRRLSQVIIAIINDLIIVNKNTPKSEIILIFTKQDRLIYIGLLILIICLSMYIVDITN